MEPFNVTVEEVSGWDSVFKLALATANRAPKNPEPSDAWKRKMMRALHSPVRARQFIIAITIPYWVSVHLVRHTIGIQHFVQSQRSDRTGEERDGKRQDEPVRHTMLVNAEALVNISRRRLCSKASPETRQAWNAIVEHVRLVDPIVAEACVPQCITFGLCPEMQPCGYDKTIAFLKRRGKYMTGEENEL